MISTDNFVFAINATLPVFLVILLGRLLNKIGILTEGFCKPANTYVFKVALPVSLFSSVAGMDLYSDFNLSFFLFCAGATTVMFMGVWAVSALCLKDKTLVGEFAQAAARSSAAILGLAFAVNIYGNTGMVPMMIVAAVPLFNMYSVVILSFSQSAEDGQTRKNRIIQAAVNAAKNPIIIGVLLGLPFALLKIKLPTVLSSTVSTVGGTATPVALLVVGASFSKTEALKRARLASAAAAVKLFLLPLVFLPIAAILGFRNSELVAIMIMVGSPTTVSCYVMAKNMKAEGVLTSNTVLLSTLFSSVSITLWLYVLKTLKLI